MLTNSLSEVRYLSGCLGPKGRLFDNLDFSVDDVYARESADWPVWLLSIQPLATVTLLDSDDDVLEDYSHVLELLQKRLEGASGRDHVIDDDDALTGLDIVDVNGGL